MCFLLSFSLTIDIVEYKEMSFVCFCVPCVVIFVIEEALKLIWLVASYMQWYSLGPTFLKLLIWLVVICKILAKVIGKLLNGSWDISGNADLGSKFERDEFLERHVARYVDSDYVGDLDNLHSTMKLGAELPWVEGQHYSQLLHYQPMRLDTWPWLKLFRSPILKLNLTRSSIWLWQLLHICFFCSDSLWIHAKERGCRAASATIRE